MGSIRKTMAAMLSVMALAAFMSDAGAQTRRSSDVNKSSAERKSGSTVTRQAPPKRQNPPQAVKPEGKPGNKGNKPADKPNVKPNDRHDNKHGKPDAKPGNRPGDRPGHGPDMRPGDRPGHGPDMRPDHHPGHGPDHRPEPPRHRDRHRYGHKVRVIPGHAHRYVYGGIVYYYHDDIWYRPSDGFYVVCRPPHGVSLAADIISDVAWAAVRIAYYNAVANTAYELASDLDIIQTYAVEDFEYFYLDGIFYARDSDGDCRVVIPPAGALVEALPEDYEMVVLADDNPYYKVDNTIFRMVIIDGKPYFEVLGQN